eukprot:1195891-Prorocentrum_minimum.AAC.4
MQGGRGSEGGQKGGVGRGSGREDQFNRVYLGLLGLTRVYSVPGLLGARAVDSRHAYSSPMHSQSDGDSTMDIGGAP